MEQQIKLPEAEHDNYPAAMVNITNKCTLKCKHCFVFREDNPNSPSDEMDSATMIEILRRLRRRYGILTMLWMGGEPLLRPDVLREGVKLFASNNITTNGTIGLIDLPRSLYVVSIDGPPEVNDSVRGVGSFDKVMKTLSRVPDDFGPTVMAQCVVTARNEEHMAELVEILRDTRLDGMTFSFYVPESRDETGLSWGSLERRDPAVREAMRLKEKYPDFIWNKRLSMELTLSQNAKSVTDNCPSKRLVLPLYLDGDRFVTPSFWSCPTCGGNLRS